MTSLVTGAAGFIGRHVVRALLARGENVRAMVRPTGELRGLDKMTVDLIAGDVRNPRAVAAAVAGCEVVYHLAAFYSSQPDDAAELYDVNVGGTKCVLRTALAAGVRRAVLTSTIGTIGRTVGDDTLPTEDTPFNLWPTASHYVKSKHLGDVAALRLAEEGLPLIIVHPCAPIGFGDSKPTVTGQRILDFLNGKQPSYLAGGINFIAVRDVAQGHLLAARSGRVGERYILGHLEGNLSLDDFLKLMAQVSGRTVPAAEKRGWRARLLRRGAPEGSRPAALTADPSKAVQELGLPQTPLHEAFTEAVAWFKDRGYV